MSMRLTTTPSRACTPSVGFYLLILVALIALPRTASAQSEVVEYYGLDHLGSVRVIFDQSGAVVDRMDYGPFGENLRAAIKFPTEQFAQLARDAETGQDYAQARNYSALSARFNRPDPVFAGLFNPQQWNRYVYATNNPMSLVDPSGLLAASSFCAWTEVSTETGLSGRLNCMSEAAQAFVSSEGGFGWTPGGVRERNDTSVWGLGVEWVTGSKKDQVFTAGDPVTEDIKESAHLEELRDSVAKSCEQATGRFDNRLSGVAGVGKYLRDYSTLITLGLTGNITATYLGSYTLDYTAIPSESGSVSLTVVIRNSSSIGSALRPPVLGYTKWWRRNIVEPLNAAAGSGPFGTTTQTIMWTEDVACKAGGGGE